MDERFTKLLVPVALLGCCLFAVYLVIFRSGYLTNVEYLGGLIFLQILLAVLWNYRQRFLPFLLVVFFWAGAAIPFSSIWTSGRWFVLAAGALIGYVIYAKDQHHFFSAFHLTALFCVLSAFVSAMVSSYPATAALKALSLLLLFLYGASGARLAFVNREEKVFRALLLVLEILVYLTAVSYLVFGFAVYGNPNSLGAVMGVVVAPLLLWGILTTEHRLLYRRRIFAFILCLLLLFYSQGRAGIVAGVSSCALLCLMLRRYRLVIQGVAGVVLLALLSITVTPSETTNQVDLPTRHDGSLTSYFLYKGKQEAGVLGSRRSAWQQTSSVIQEHPWFGSGFGTVTGIDAKDAELGKFSSSSGITREHGNSYLAILESMGLLGVMPFLALALTLLVQVTRVLALLRRTGSPNNFAVPVALVLLAGLVHAGFEDWLFAVGYYLCVFFWIFAFALMDLVRSTAPATFRPVAQWAYSHFPQGFRAVVPNR